MSFLNALVERTSSTKETTRTPQHLKIREWPPLGDLAEAHPDRYADFTEHLPLPEYTHREGQLNLAARLPSFFVRPDLGPRLHIAQDLTSQPKASLTFSIYLIIWHWTSESNNCHPALVSSVIFEEVKKA